MEEIETEIKERTGNRRAIYQKMPFIQMPATWTNQQSRHFGIQGVLFALRTHIADCALHGIAEIRLPLQIVLPRRRIRILEVRHENIRAGIERVDDHLAIHGPCDFHAPVEQILWNRRDRPLGLADMGRLGKEVRQLASIDLPLANLAPGEEFLPTLLKIASQVIQELAGFGCENLSLDCGER